MNQTTQPYVPMRAYYTMVADKLLSDHGSKALYYAAKALEKMKHSGDDEGLFMWKQIQTIMIDKFRLAAPKTKATYH